MVSKVETHQHHNYLKKVRGLYEISEEADKEWEARRKHINSLSSLSLFNDQESFEENDKVEKSHDPERPITPINDSVKCAPKTLAAFSKLIHRRINPRPEWGHISIDDQSSLGGVIMGEVSAVWPTLRRQVADPFLTEQQNKELQRRITIHCVTVCEQLFLHYSDKIKLLNSRGVFSNPANLSRIRAQLALDAGKYLNILSVRRHIISDLKRPPTKELVTFNRDELIKSPTTPIPPHSPRHLSFRHLVKSSRPQRKLKYQFNMNAELQSMRSQMPTLNVAKIQHLIPTEESATFTYREDVTMEDEEAPEEVQKQEENLLPPTPKLRHRAASEPMLRHELLLDELNNRFIEENMESPGIPSRLQQSPRRSHSIMLRIRPQTPKKSETSLGLDRAPSGGLENLDLTNPAEDLKMLVAAQERAKLKEKEDEKDRPLTDATDIPPLIQALTRREIQNEKVRKLKIQEEELDRRRKEEEEEMRKPLPSPQYPQPAVVQTKLPGMSNPVDHTPITIRASDVKINDRVDLSTVTLEPYLPVYNDLTGEISQATVKELDANLFQGGELREVYEEIMKTVPNLHQHYDNDPVIVSPATNVDLTNVLASSTLTRPRSQQVINPRLRREESEIPWEGQQMDWAKVTRAQQRSAYPGSDVTSQSQGQGETVTAFHQFSPSQLTHPAVEKGSRAYASWLAWWKSLINTDDYFKYLSTQDTDFLSVLFHFYDSDAAESETESMRTAKLEAQRERDRKMAELKKEKEEHIEGHWNVKTVTFGGLGKDPEIEEEEFSDFGSPHLMSQSHSFSPGGSKGFSDSSSLSPRSSRPRSGSSRKRSSMASSKKRDGSTGDSTKDDKSTEPTIQERLEIVWRRLRMPDSQKLNFALKYSTDKFIKLLPDIVSAWEHATDLILEREELMLKLEMFEKDASDPNRFFEKGHKGSSALRLSEAKTRANLYKRLEVIESTIKTSLQSIKSRFSDVVTYNGRPYMEKMSWDKIEMLYWLQQERRCIMLKDHGRPQQLDSFLRYGKTNNPSILASQTSPRYTQLPLNSVKICIPE